jgi:hypothetical protein
VEKKIKLAPLRLIRERAAKYRPFGEKELDCFVFLRKGEEEDEEGGGFDFG